MKWPREQLIGLLPFKCSKPLKLVVSFSPHISV